jgi:hypothetical protein
MGKGKEVPHTGHIQSGRFKLDLIHSDVTGPYPVRGFKGQRFVVSFIDDYTGFSEVHFMKHKSEVFHLFQNFRTRHETDTMKIHFWHSDNGGEYVSNENTAVLFTQGITHHTTAPYTPEQNPVAERFNGVIMSKANPLLIKSGLPQKYWPLAYDTANYLRNISPYRNLPATPWELWYGIAPHFDHLMIFGSKAFGHIRKVKGFKAHQKVGHFVGYDGNSIQLLLADGKVWRMTGLTAIETPSKTLPETRSSIAPRTNTAPLSATEEEDGIIPDRTPCNGGASANNTTTDNSDDRPHRAPHPTTRAIESSQQADEVQALFSTPSFKRALDTLVTEHSRKPHQPDPDHIRTNFALFAPVAQQRCRQTFQLLAAATSTEAYEPNTYKQAISSEQSQKWREAMDKELRSLEENNVWDLTNLPDGVTALSGRWVYKLKRGIDGSITRYKARWVVRGFEQEEGVDYHETFASVVKPMSYKALFAIAAAKDWEIEQMDVITAFLYGQVEEDIYIKQPTGFEDGTDKICKLNRALYGLRQSPRIWYNTLSNFLNSEGLTALDNDFSVFHRGNLIVAIYVDDLLIIGDEKDEINDLKKQLSDRFKMTDMGPVQYYLGMSVTRDRQNRTIRLGQQAYIEKILTTHFSANRHSKPIPINPTARPEPAQEDYCCTDELRQRYQSAVGSLMYAMLGTRPDIAFAVSIVSRFASNPTDLHWKLVEDIFSYLHGHKDLQLTFQGGIEALVGFTDSDWGADLSTRRSTSGYVFNIGSGAISWSSKRQATIAMSTCEAEYVGQSNAIKEAIWLKRLLIEISASSFGPAATVIFCDNQGAIALAKNPQSHGRNKAIDMQHHFQREKVAKGDVKLEWIPTNKMVADGLTKALPKAEFVRFRSLLGVA